MKRIVIGLVVIVVLLGGAAVVAPGFVDWTKYKPEIISKVHDASGYDIAIGGGLSMRVIPSPRLLVENLSIASPVGEKDPLVSLDRAEVSVALFPLLSGQVVVNKVYLKKPQIRLSVAADGTQSWAVPKKEPAPPGAAAAPSLSSQGGVAGNAVSLNGIVIEDGAVSYADQKTGKSYKLDKVNLSVHADSLTGPFSADGDFVYNNQQVSADIKTGTIGNGTDSTKLQATIGLHDLDSKIIFSGVVGLKDDHEVQGETEIGTNSLKKLLDFATAGDNAPLLDQHFNAKGMLTASSEKASFQNLKFSLGDASFAGNVSATNLKGGAKPMALDITLAADKAVDVNQFMPQPPAKPAGKGGKEAAEKTKAESFNGFIPSSFTLPTGFTASVNFSAPSVQYNDLQFKTFSLTGGWQDQKASGSMKGDLPGGGSLAGTFSLSFGSSSKAASGDSATLSDPVLAYTIDLNTPDGRKAVSSFMPKEKAKDLPPAFKGALAVNASGEVRPNTASIKKASLRLQDMVLGLGGSYTPARKGGRDAIALTASADRLDLDRWMGAAAPAKAPAPSLSNTAPPPPLKATIKESTDKLQLPFDIDLSVSANSVRWKGEDYNKLSMAGKLAGRKLEIKTFQVQDPSGNNILVAGTVGDLSALKDLDISLQGKTQDLKKVLKGIDAKYATLPDTLKEAEVVAQLKGQSEKMSFTSNVKAMGGTLDASGTLASVLDNPSVSGLTLRLKSPNYVELARIFNPEFKGSVAIKKNLDIFGSMERKGDVYTFDNFQATVGPSTFSGDLSIDMGGKRPSIKTRLQMGDVPVDSLIGHESAAQASADSGGGGGSSSGGSRGGHWSRTPINAEVMRMFDLDMTASAKSLSYGTWLVNNGNAALVLKDGTLTISKLSGGMYGGQMAMTGKLVAPAKAHEPISVDGQVQMQNVALESFVKSFAGSRLVKASGNVSVDADIKASGESPAALISSLSGKGKGDGKNILFEGFDLAKLSRTLAAPSSSVLGNITSVLGTTMAGGTTSFDTLDTAFTISQGIVNIGTLKLTGKDAVVSSPGTVNLPQWAVDMESTITLSEPKDAPPLKIVFKGPLDQPGKAFGQSALNAYFGSKVQNMLQGALQKRGILPKPEAAPGAITASPDQAAPAAGTQPQEKPKKVKPEDLFKNVLQGVLQGQ